MLLLKRLDVREMYVNSVAFILHIQYRRMERYIYS